MSESEDKRLVRESLDGNPAAFEKLVGKYGKIVYNIALRMVKNEEEAQDVSQTAFIKAYENLGSYKPQYKFFSWLYRIAVNESLNTLAKNKWYEELDSGIQSSTETPEKVYQESRLDDEIRSALMELTGDHRAVIILKHFLELSLREIGDILEIPEKRVKSRLFSARQRLGGILLKRGLTLP